MPHYLNFLAIPMADSQTQIQQMENKVVILYLIRLNGEIEGSLKTKRCTSTIKKTSKVEEL